MLKLRSDRSVYGRVLRQPGVLGGCHAVLLSE
jgi:hypothetical protein